MNTCVLYIIFIYVLECCMIIQTIACDYLVVDCPIFIGIFRRKVGGMWYFFDSLICEVGNNLWISWWVVDNFVDNVLINRSELLITFVVLTTKFVYTNRHRHIMLHAVKPGQPLPDHTGLHRITYGNLWKYRGNRA